ncbi:eukaryotic translation initiation factor 3 subunit I-like [Raphidocelis subcapitata]|uniref:Eukaryotic translation initiation factor 3 subunit I n=1 Tax=Raphidocelis subcapitata TaxID=307507 RepID=A0A2V0PFG8_9CHLO|nr:eukaryotic translation initiation factor 3 subunit I-like [Raphidocelis subcapitata]|eukprot:GBF98269.1 eukaryotic translation initiation factor 3 subunit I-like [Raphidocelis subcapitata]
MRPYLLKGHERPLTQVKYNREGDLLISCAKNLYPCLWLAEDGRRLGTYEGHNGAVWTCEISLDSQRLITASADQTVRIWELPTGKELHQIKMNEPCRASALSVGEKLLAFTTDSFMGVPPQIHIVDVDLQAAPGSGPIAGDKPRLTFDAPKGRITRVGWIEQNRVLITSHDGGFVRRWDAETGEMLQEAQVHEDAIQDMQFSADGSYVVTASLDKAAKLVDVTTLEVLKTYKTGRFVQSAAVSPILDHILLGGGQDASQVTTTSAKAGGFEARFFHKIYTEEFGNVRGHFGPINSVAFSPDGRSFVTGGEDGYVRVHHFDNDFFSTKWL